MLVLNTICLVKIGAQRHHATAQHPGAKMLPNL